MTKSANHRQTIRKPASLRGHGLHTGAPCELTFVPAVSGRGVVFVRRDLPGRPEIPASLTQVAATERRTRLEAGSAFVETVEHVLAAVWALGYDDLEIHLNGPEPPIGDGSADHFARVLEGAGRVDHPDRRAELTPDSAFTMTANGSEYQVTPSPRASLEVTIEWDHPIIGRQRGEFSLDPQAVRREVLPARTFAFAAEVESMRSKGLIRGGSLNCALVLDDSGLLQGALHWPDEFVRHKTLDLIGDLALLGRRVHCHISAWRPGHRGNILLARALNDHSGE